MVFSRDGEPLRYVQDVLMAQASELQSLGHLILTLLEAPNATEPSEEEFHEPICLRNRQVQEKKQYK